MRRSSKAAQNGAGQPQDGFGILQASITLDNLENKYVNIDVYNHVPEDGAVALCVIRCVVKCVVGSNQLLSLLQASVHQKLCGKVCGKVTPP